ncbi:DUF1190 domain-containing protein [Wohlfahrtiimonas chitiniclastica]|uniref:DUF1190 domain-containing protein n=1 Tax=Wohlfahrtiimonas chitiniclastica TaxID=400946 RepID=UPI000B984339|nr:DUF1190 domain-containing protein [Wohlfahrtiimonas chitiniclastica]OYQ76350.1 hypothetical protein B9T18_03045 [Wohlfahrtiimonas chitiniclastica]
MKKRTHSINKSTFRKNFKLKPLAVSLLVAFGVVACGSSNDTEQLTIYSDANDCINNNPNMVAECKSVYEGAIKEAIETAPKYATIEECTADFGAENCQSVQQANNAVNPQQMASNESGGSFFMPLLAGFMMGKLMSGMMGNNNAAHKPVYSPKDASGRPTNYYDSTGKSYGAAQSGRTVSVPKNELKSKPAGTVKRGGFGQMVNNQRMAAQSKATQSRSTGSTSKASSSNRSTSFGG